MLIDAMFLIFATMPKKAEAESDGSFNLGEIGITPEKNWTRQRGPHSPAEKDDAVQS